MTFVVSKLVKEKTEFEGKNVRKVFYNILRVTNFDRSKRSCRECCGRKARIEICVLGVWKLRTIRKNG
jgi:hypothetical protein